MALAAAWVPLLLLTACETDPPGVTHVLSGEEI